jgi:UDP-N-acetylglucosamine 1-carboxyvinyltransferase
LQQCLRICGKQKTQGSIRINGAKNSAVAVLPAALLTEKTVKVENLPSITDIYRLTDILSVLGAKVSILSETSLGLDLSGVDSFCPPPWAG